MLGADNIHKHVITIGEHRIGDGSLCIIAGPCAVESFEQTLACAHTLANCGVKFLRGGAYKPRTSPYSFQGLGRDGLTILSRIKKETSLCLVSEIMDVRALDFFDDIDILQVGARNMHNQVLLKELGHSGKPILLKRGFCATIEELLCAAAYIREQGNDDIILCERGIRSFDPQTRNVLDVCAIPLLHTLSDLPIFADPSHATGHRELVEPAALACVAASADGLEIEVHPDPAHALSDGKQALTLDDFPVVLQKIHNVHNVLMVD